MHDHRNNQRKALILLIQALRQRDKRRPRGFGDVLGLRRSSMSSEDGHGPKSEVGVGNSGGGEKGDEEFESACSKEGPRSVENEEGGRGTDQRG